MKMTGLAEMKKIFEFPNPFSFRAPHPKFGLHQIPLQAQPQPRFHYESKATFCIQDFNRSTSIIPTSNSFFRRIKGQLVIFDRRESGSNTLVIPASACKAQAFERDT